MRPYSPGIQQRREDRPGDMMECECGFTCARGEIPVRLDPGPLNCTNDDALEPVGETKCPGCFARDSFTRREGQ